jgi:amino acid permease
VYKKRGVEKSYSGFFGKNKTLVAITTLVGTIVGAGILGIPYVVAEAGVLYGFFLIVFLGIAYLFLNLFAGEVILRTPGKHQLTGYAEKYLGKNGKRFMAISMVIVIYGALTAYIIGEGAALHAIFGVGSPLLYSLLFFLLTLIIVSKGIKATGKAEFFLIIMLLLIVVLIGVFSYSQIDLQHFTLFDAGKFFIPYGVVLFAFMGTPAIPELQEVLGNQKKKLKKAIIVGSILPIILYIAFTFFIVGIVGLQDFTLLEPNQRIATIALSIYAQPILGIFANILAVLAMFTSFLVLGIALVDMYHYDYGISPRLALLLTFSLPFVMVLFNLTTFIAILGVTGAFAGGLEGILVMLMYWKAKKLGTRKPEYVMGKHRVLGWLLIILFSLGILYQLIGLI